MGRSNKHNRDIYYRRAKEDGWRARSAFKLLEINDEFGIFQGVTRSVDLCAAPGSWSQVLSKKMWQSSLDKDQVKIVAVDIQDMAPLDGVIQIKGDITRENTVMQIIDSLQGQKAQLVICDGALDVTGLHDLDEFIQAQLLFAALNISTHILSDEGTFLAKMFKGQNLSLIYAQFKVFFDMVQVIKPNSSRSGSIESFIICQGFKIPQNYTPMLVDPISNQPYSANPNTKLTDANALIIPFISNGDLSGYDKLLAQDLEKDNELDSILC